MRISERQAGRLQFRRQALRATSLKRESHTALVECVKLIGIYKSPVSPVILLCPPWLTSLTSSPDTTDHPDRGPVIAITIADALLSDLRALCG
jgi:hypothetical protein